MEKTTRFIIWLEVIGLLALIVKVIVMLIS